MNGTDRLAMYHRMRSAEGGVERQNRTYLLQVCFILSLSSVSPFSLLSSLFLSLPFSLSFSLSHFSHFTCYCYAYCLLTLSLSLRFPTCSELLDSCTSFFYAFTFYAALLFTIFLLSLTNFLCNVKCLYRSTRTVFSRLMPSTGC